MKAAKREKKDKHLNRRGTLMFIIVFGIFRELHRIVYVTEM
jgi:hypothetical protein